jgi:putative pyruvate formate lyase activating enzyme
MDVLKHLASILPTDNILLSLMSQYTPDFALDSPHKELHRRITSFEYRSVADLALELGFDGFFQERSSAKKDYTPDFKG